MVSCVAGGTALGEAASFDGSAPDFKFPRDGRGGRPTGSFAVDFGGAGVGFATAVGGATAIAFVGGRASLASSPPSLSEPDSDSTPVAALMLGALVAAALTPIAFFGFRDFLRRCGAGDDSELAAVDFFTTLLLRRGESTVASVFGEAVDSAVQLVSAETKTGDADC